MHRRVALAVFASGEGTTLDTLAELVHGGHLPVRLVLVLSDRPHAPAIEKARVRGLATCVLPFHGTSPEEWSGRASAALREREAELVLLAGFLSILPSAFLAEWAGRVVNVHPSLLPLHGGPGMYGARVHAAVLSAGETRTGASVHVVTDRVDAGPVLLQEAVPVLPSDTPAALRDRVRPVELRLIAELLREVADGRRRLPLGQSDGGPRTRASEDSAEA